MRVYFTFILKQRVCKYYSCICHSDRAHLSHSCPFKLLMDTNFIIVLLQTMSDATKVISPYLNIIMVSGWTVTYTTINLKIIYNLYNIWKMLFLNQHPTPTLWFTIHQYGESEIYVFLDYGNTYTKLYD